MTTSVVDDEASVEFEAAEKLIMRWDSSASEEASDRMIFDGDRSHRTEADRYLRAVDEIRRSMESATVSDGDDSFKSKTSAIQIAMARLEDEFRNLLISHSLPIETDALPEPNSPSVLSSARTETTEDLFDDEEYRGEEQERMVVKEEEDGSRSCSSYRSASSIREIDLIPTEAICDLRQIAERMISNGYMRECVQVYGSVRKPAMDDTFRRVGIERLSIGEVQRLEWDVLEAKIRRWIRSAKICVRILFASERRLCEQIFDGLSLVAEENCFLDAVKGPAIQLFNFPEAIGISRRSPEKLFKTLDLHDTLSDLLPDVSAIFRSDSSESVRTRVTDILSRLAEAARGILTEFENAVQREPSKIPVPGGTLHPLTRYVMNYISLISDYKQTLVDLITAAPSVGPRFPDDPEPRDIEFPESENLSPLALHLIWIIGNLQFNLEDKSKLYRDASLSHLFLMNNVHYIVQKVKSSPELRELIGDWYLKRLMGKFRQSATNYQRSAWVRILHCLRDEGIHVSGSFSSGVSKTTLRERFKTFNSAFEEAHRIQAMWFVPDSQLREELRISIAEKLLPAYRSFLGRFRSHIESWRHPEMYIKYSVEDLESAILDFFEGCPASVHNRRRLH